MVRSFSIALVLIVLLASSALAEVGKGIYSSRLSRETGTVIAAVEIKGKGNL